MTRLRYLSCKTPHSRRIDGIWHPEFRGFGARPALQADTLPNLLVLARCMQVPTAQVYV